MAAVPDSDTARPVPATPPPTPDAAPLPWAVVINLCSGHEDDDARLTTLRTELQRAGRAHHLLPIRHAGDLPRAVDEAIQWARAQRGAVIAAGGDGTLNAVAQAVLPTGLPLGVLPQGTFNYFGREHGVPTELADGVRALLGARVQPVTVGQVNQRLFLVNASLGLYPQLLQDREAIKARFGRHRAVALVAALLSVVREHRQCEIDLELGDSHRPLRTTTLLVGASRIQLERLGIPEAAALDEGRLVAIVVRPVGTLSMLGLVLRGALGQLGEAMAVDSFAFSRLSVRPKDRWSAWAARWGWSASRRGGAPAGGGRAIKVAIDGEVELLRPPLHFALAPQPLQLLVPSTADEGTDGDADAARPPAA